MDSPGPRTSCCTDLPWLSGTADLHAVGTGALWEVHTIWILLLHVKINGYSLIPRRNSILKTRRNILKPEMKVFYVLFAGAHSCPYLFCHPRSSWLSLSWYLTISLYSFIFNFILFPPVYHLGWLLASGLGWAPQPSSKCLKGFVQWRLIPC